tara:strand:- start:18395 stop:19780 length:1386 start_codon:yes stop_codon:yes gene_type:complete
MTSDFIARTGRVQNWMDDPTSRLPVSCTVFNVNDSMEGNNGIEASWKFASSALRYGAGVAIHLSELRPNGTQNKEGLTASGPVSFARIYSSLNETIRRGGVYKNGAIVAHIDLSHTDVEEFIDAPRQQLPWIKKCINLNRDMWLATPQPLKEKIFKAIQAGDLWLAKIKHDQRGERIRANVCLEVFLKSRGTCLLQHVNLGACDHTDLVTAFTKGMAELCALHPKTNVESTGEYLSPEVDRQVGLGMLGMANFLKRHGVSYKDFGEALRIINSEKPASFVSTPAYELAAELKSAIEIAAQIARYNNMDRAFAIAPTASCSYRHTDKDGFTTAPEIAPPISREVDRDSGTFGVESYSYGEVEIASEVGWDAYKSVADGICQLLENTGLFHGYSFNSWSDVVTYDDEFIKDWLDSPQTSLYYALQVQPDTLRKDDASAILDDDYADIFNFKQEDDQECLSCAE